MVFSAQDTLGKYRRKIFLAILIGGLHSRGTRLAPFSFLGEVGREMKSISLCLVLALEDPKAFRDT